MPGKQPSELARERDARLDQGSAALARHLLAVFRPEVVALLQPQADGKRGTGCRVVRLGDSRATPPRNTPWKGSDLNVYRFMHPDGSVIVATRRELRKAHPEINPGNLSDLVNGKVRRTKGFQFLGRVDSLSTED